MKNWRVVIRSTQARLSIFRDLLQKAVRVAGILIGGTSGGLTLKKEWNKRQREYIRIVSFEPRTTDQILTMNYCFAWCDAHGKTMEDWFKSGFNNHMYSPIKDKRKQKLLRLQMEATTCN